MAPAQIEYAHRKHKYECTGKKVPFVRGAILVTMELKITRTQPDYKEMLFIYLIVYSVSVCLY